MKIDNYYVIKGYIKTNIIIRILYLPIHKIRAKIDNYIYKKHGYGYEIKRFKEKHAGKRCFIIGNGPSLTTEDLERLKDEICFATNRIYNIYNSITWRPTFYTCIDPIILNDDKELVLNEDNIVKFIGFRVREKRKCENIYYLNDTRQYFTKLTPSKKIKFSNDVSREIIGHATVSYVAIQLAVYMGFKEIYLLGVDHNFYKMTDNNNKIIVNNQINKNHFGKQKESNKNLVFDSFGAEMDYIAAKDYADKHDVKIFNATRGGRLEIFSRVDFDYLFNDEDDIQKSK